jgi:hypothetical protein
MRGSSFGLDGKCDGAAFEPQGGGACIRLDIAVRPDGTVVLHTGVGVLADEGAGAACWAV